MLFYLLSAEELADCWSGSATRSTPDDIPRNVDYYLARTVARLDAQPQWCTPGSWRAPTARAPGGCSARRWPATSHDIQGGTTPRASTSAPWPARSTWSSAATVGIRPRAGVLWIEPQLPRELTALQTTILYRDHWGIAVGVRDGALHVGVPPSDRRPIVVGHRERLVSVAPGERLEIPLSRPVGEAV